MKISPILSTLDAAQAKGLSKLKRHKGGAIFHRVGTGKTRIALAWFATIAKKLLICNPIFVVITRRKAFDDWFDEARTVGIDWIICNYETYAWKPTQKPRILLLSHGMVATLAKELEEMGGGIHAVAIDEGFLFKTPSSQHCKCAHRISEIVGRAAVLSGSIMTARSLEDVFGQMYAINKHQSLGRTLTDFRSRFMTALKIGNGNVQKFVNSADSYVQVSHLIAPHTSIYFPPSDKIYRDIVRQIEPSPMQLDYIEKLKGEYWIQTEKGELDIKSAPALITKCQQISDGFLQLPKGIVQNVDSAKLGYLVEQVMELIACGEQVVVWCAFRESVFRVLQQLQKHKLHAYPFMGGMEFDLVGWKRNGQVAVATVDSGSSVNHFAQCAYAIYYSLNWKWLSLQQSKGRTDRKSSQHRTCYYYFLQLKGSLDSYVHRIAHTSGREEAKLMNQIELRQWAKT